jgi:hypothetical protein
MRSSTDGNYKRYKVKEVNLKRAEKARTKIREQWVTATEQYTEALGGVHRTLSTSMRLATTSMR